jgi:ribosomal protein S18 acetylase RimI-like enzyme
LAVQLSRVALPIAEGLQEATGRFDCVGDRYDDDPIAIEVRDFLRDGGFHQGIEHGFSSTYVLVDDEQPMPRDVLGYTTLAVDSVRLTTAERRALDNPDFPDFGAIRLAMLGVDHQCQGRGFGTLILRAVADMATEIANVVAVRFLLADANVRQQAWYEHHGWVLNRAKTYSESSSEYTVSMRLDLLLDDD